MSLEVDGRTARRNRNLDAVLDAVLELFTEDSLEPGAADVAERSGVSLRSVYRYFDDTEALVRAAIARNIEQVQPLFEIDDLGEGPLEERIERIVDRRLTLYEETAPMTRASLRRASGNELIREQVERSQRAMRVQVEQMFAPELARMATADRREVVAALDVLLGFPTLEHLRRTRCMSPSEAGAVLLRAVSAMLARPA